MVNHFPKGGHQYWTVSNQYLYYLQTEEKEGLYRMELSTNQIEFLTEETPNAVGGVISASTEELLIVKTDRAESDIYQVNLK